MNRRCLLCAALLLASPVIARESPDSAKEGTAVSPTPKIQIECLPATRAAELVGKQGCVVGRITRVTTPKNGSTHLSICTPRKGCQFHASVPGGNRNSVGDLTSLRGKLVAFFGDVTLYRGRPQIVVKDRDQVRITAGNPPSEFDTAQVRPKTVPAKNLRAW